MSLTSPPKPRVFVDADVLFAGAASPGEQGASLLVLRLAEITLIEAVVSQQVITEAERNLGDKLPAALPAFRHLVSHCLEIIPNPAAEDLRPHQGLAEPQDLPILVAVLQAGCPLLTTFNIRHYQPGHADITVLRPGDFILRVRDRLAFLR
jgi:predicted nucleic acid-binding protein